MKEELSLKQKRVMTYFIEATEKLMLEDSIDGLSIRKIATEAGYNSATLYNYFEELDHLILFASIHYIREYVDVLGDHITPEMNALEKYRTIYKVANHHFFRSPEIFYNLFFGKHSAKLSSVITQYYDLFPDDLVKHDDLMKVMLRQGTMQLRDQTVMNELVEQGFVSAEKADLTVSIIVRTQQSYLYEVLVKGVAMNLEEQEKSFLTLFDYVLEMAK